MFILSGGFSLISVSQGMVLVGALSAGSPIVEAAPLPAASVSPQSQSCLQPTAVTKDQCHSSAALEADRGWGPHKVPGEVAHQRTFYLFQLSQHLFPPVKRSFGYCCNLHPATPLPPSSLVPALGGAGRDTSASPSLLGPGRLGRMNSGPGYVATLPRGISAAPLKTTGLYHHPAGGMLLALLTAGRNRPLSQPSTSEAIKRLQSALLNELLLAFLS